MIPMSSFAELKPVLILTLTGREEYLTAVSRINFNLSKFDIDKRLALRNCVEPKVALHIFEMAFHKPQLTLTKLRV
jgi:hypothetical protein